MKTDIETTRSPTTLLQTREYVSINPNKELNFTQTKSKYTASFSLFNLLSSDNIIFRIRVTESSEYIVYPTAGIIFPKENRTIKIHFLSKSSVKDRFDDKFLVQAYIYNGEDLPDEPKQVIKTFERFKDLNKSFQNIKLKVHFEINGLLEDDSTEIDTPLRTPSPKAKFSAMEKRRTSIVAIESPIMASPTRRTKVLIKQSPNSALPKIQVNDETPQQYNNTELDVLKEKSSPFSLKSPGLGKFVSAHVGTLKRNDTSTPTIESEIKDQIDIYSHNMGLLNLQPRLKPLMSSPTIFKTPLYDQREEDNLSNEEELGEQDQSCMSVIMQENMYKKKCEKLETKFKQQKNQLMRIAEERDSILNEMNKLRFTFSADKVVQEPVVAKPIRSKGSTFELWQIMMVSIIFLIVGSCFR